MRAVTPCALTFLNRAIAKIIAFKTRAQGETTALIQSQFAFHPQYWPADQIEVDNPPCIVSFFAPCRLPSSMVEQLTLNQLVPGSSPGGATSFPKSRPQGRLRQRYFPVQLLAKRRKFLRRRSSMVEHLFCKQAVAGSNPIAGSIRSSDSPLRAFSVFTARWCNGSTNDSDSFCLGSSPSRAAIHWHFQTLG
jgi:hypothetical protein